MTNNTIKHLGIVENIQGSHLSVRIVQTSACAACSAKGTQSMDGHLWAVILIRSR